MTKLVPMLATAANVDRSPDQHTELQLLSAADVLLVHVIPSDEVITRLPVPEDATAMKRLNSAAQITEFHEFDTVDVLVVHVVPLGEVITLFVVSVATATNKDS